MGFEALLGPALGMITSLIGGNKADKAAKQQNAIALMQIKQQRLEDAQSVALAQAQSYAQAAAAHRNGQIIGLAAVGFGAVLISGILIWSAKK